MLCEIVFSAWNQLIATQAFRLMVRLFEEIHFMEQFFIKMHNIFSFTCQVSVQFMCCLPIEKANSDWRLSLNSGISVVSTNGNVVLPDHGLETYAPLTFKTPSMKKNGVIITIHPKILCCCKGKPMTNTFNLSYR